MIRLNLLKSLQTRTPMTPRTRRPVQWTGRTEEPGKKRRVWLLILLAVIVAGSGLYFTLRSGKPKQARTEISETAAETTTPSAMMTATTDTSPPQVPSDSLDYPEISDSARDAASETAAPAPAATPTVTASIPKEPASPDAAFDPSGNVASQYFSGRRILQDLQTASPAGVGFTHIEFTPPAAFSVRGVAATEADLQHFQSAMASLPGVTMQPGQSRPTGAGKAARIFTCSGEVHFPDSSDAPRNRVIARDQAAMALQRFMNAAKAQGIDLPQPQLRDSTVMGGAVRLLYHIEAPCDYSGLQALLEKLRASRSSPGIQRLALDARGQESLALSLDLILYAK